MKFLKVVAIVLISLGLLSALGIVGRIETEDRMLKSGEIDEADLLSDSTIMTIMGVSISMLALGGIIQLVIASRVNWAAYADKYDEPAFDTILSASEQIQLVDDDFVGEFELLGVEYALHRTESDTYVITDVDNYNIQYWKGNIHELKALEAKYDN